MLIIYDFLVQMLTVFYVQNPTVCNKIINDSCGSEQLY